MFEPVASDLPQLLAQYSPPQIWTMVAERFPQEAAMLSRFEFFDFTYRKMNSLPCDIATVRDQPLPEITRLRVWGEYLAFDSGKVTDYFARCLLDNCVYGPA